MWAWSPPQQQAIFKIFHFQFKIDKKYKYLSKHSVNIPYESHNKKSDIIILWNTGTSTEPSVRRLPYRGLSTGGDQGGRAPAIIFLIFVLQNVTKLVLDFTFAAISICPGNKSWSIYELPPDCTLLSSLVFTLVLNWKIIIMLL